MSDGQSASADVAPSGPLVTFAIPLIPFGTPTEQAYRDRMLSATLRSIYAQTDGDFRVLLIGDRRPAIDFATDRRVEFVLYRSSPSPGFYKANGDKGAKLGVTARMFGERGGGYFMPVDMDDFLHRDLIAFVRANPDPNGYIIDRGYILDARRMAVTHVPDPRYHTAPYHKTCGSCTIFNMAPGDVAPDGRFFRLNSHGHFMNFEEAIAEGRPLRLLPFDGGVYTFNHGINITAARAVAEGQAAERRNWLEALAQHSIPAADVAADFSLPTSYPLLENEPARPLDRATLTVAISTHRRPEGLRRLLTALRPQVAGFPERNVVVVNDGSHDEGYGAVIAEFEDVVRYSALPANVGIAAARNTAAAMATGDYIVFTDDDCEPPPAWLDWLAARLARAPELDVVAGLTEPRWPSGRHRFLARVQAHHRLLPQASRMDGGILFATANVAIRRRLFESIGGFGFPGKFHGAAEDTELASRLSLAGAAMCIDQQWRMRHDVGEDLKGLRRRYWRYGYANGALLDIGTAPPANDTLPYVTQASTLANWRANYRELKAASAGFSRWRLARAASAAVAALVRLSYIDGAAAAIRRSRNPDTSARAREAPAKA